MPVQQAPASPEEARFNPEVRETLYTVIVSKTPHISDPAMKNLFQNKNARLILFSKYPVSGKAKTRLIPALGPAGAAELQKQMAEKIVRTSTQFIDSRDIDMEICFEGGTKKKMKAWLGAVPRYSHQIPGDIGIRMHRAMANAFLSGCSRVVLIGTDIPDISETVLEQAFFNLTNNDLVLGPSTDGGYWLIGLNRPCADLFQGITWGTSSVFEQTLHIARKHHLKYQLLDPLTDIDTVNNLKKIYLKKALAKPYISVIIPTLNEADHIAAAIENATHPDSEIIVVDGGSTDDTIETAKKNGAQVITGPKGRARQQNIGAKRALGRVLLFLHSDTLLPLNYISYVFDTLMDRRVAMGAFQFKTDFSHPFMKLVELGANIRSQYFGLPYGDQALFLYKSLFDSMNGFPEVAIAEDFFFVQKLSTLGKIHIVPVPIITSGRRWKIRGPIRTWLINTIILGGCKIGISPEKLKSLYRLPKPKA